MIRALNFAFIALTGLTCLGLYRIAEQARVTAADLRETRVAITREKETLTVLGAEWARLTQPARIQALAGRYLDLTDQPEVQLSSLTLLPAKDAPLSPPLRDANAVVPDANAPLNAAPATNAAPPVANETLPTPHESVAPDSARNSAPLVKTVPIALHTGT